MKVEILLSSKCNNKCLFCSVYDMNFTKSIEQVKKEIDSVSGRGFEEINFTGGEPTIYPWLMEAIEYANGKFSAIRITTNGRRMSDMSFTKKLIKAGLNGAIFSLHSHIPEVHDRLSQAEGAFKQLIKGIKNFSNFTDDISINTVITSMNYKHLPELVEFISSEIKPRSICFIYPTFYGNIVKNSFLMVPYEKIAPFAERAIDIAKSNGIYPWIFNFPACFIPKKLNLLTSGLIIKQRCCGMMTR